MSKHHSQLSDGQIRSHLTDIAKQFGNRECFDCANTIRQFLEINNIQGQLIKLNTGDPHGNGFIYHDRLEEVISENGVHVGVQVIFNKRAFVFDNFDYGVPFADWLENLVFPDKIHFDREFQVEIIDF